MKRKFTYLLTALALLAFLSPTTAWGGVKLADTQRITQKGHETIMLATPDRGGEMTRDQYSYTFTATLFDANNQTKTLNGIDWTLSGTSNSNSPYFGYDGTKGQQFGSGSKYFTSFSLSTSGITGTITEIKINTSGANGIAGTLNVMVGNQAFGNSYTLTKDATTATFSGSASGVITFNYAQTSTKAIYIKSITVTYTSGSAPTVAAPTFSPASGTEFGDAGLEVTISQADNQTIYYTLDGSDPDNTSTEYTQAISLTTTTTIKAIAYDGEDHSSIATATYTYVDPNAPGTENNPYSVAQAIENTPNSGTSANVYIHGIVSSFYNTNIMGDGNNYRYYISDDGTTTTQLLVYKGKGLNNVAFSNADDLLVGDEVTILGGLTMYQNAPEIAANNYIVSLVRPVVPTLTVSPNEVTVLNEGGSGNFTVTPENVTNAFGGNVKFYDPTNTENELEENPTWITVNHDYSEMTLSYSVTDANNATEPRTACFRFVVMCEEGLATSNLITVTQEGVPAPAIILDEYTRSVPAAGEEAILAVFYENIEEIVANIAFYEADGETAATYDWITAVIDEDNNVSYSVVENEGEARTAYFKVYASVGVYSNLITITQAAHEAPNVTWNLSTNSYDENPTAELIQWSSDFAIMKNERNGSGNTAVNNYIPTTQNSTRFYKNNKLTISPVTGYTITSVVFTATTNGYASALNESAWTNATASASGTTVTVTPTDGATAISAVIGATCGFTAVTVYYEQNTTPSIAVALPTANVPAQPEGGMYEGTLAINYANIEISDMEDFGVKFYDAEEQELQAAPEGFEVLVAEEDLSVGEGYVVSYTVQPNTQTQERVARFKVYVGEVFSNLVTITQERFVVDYATLPFTFTGGWNDIDNTVGLTDDGLGSDYGTSAKLKFDDSGDWVILKLNEAPTSLSYDIKGNSLSGNYQFDVLVSANGVNYETLASYTTGNINNSKVITITHINLASEVRYIKWIYTTKASGNVGMGNIRATAYYDIYGTVTVADLAPTDNKKCTIYEGGALIVTGTMTNTSTANFIIEDGGQYTGNSVAATMKKHIDACTYSSDNNTGYTLIASPMNDLVYNNIAHTNLTANSYDLYEYVADPSDGKEWHNFKETANNLSTLKSGQGYLYANSTSFDLLFMGNTNTTFSDVQLPYEEGDLYKSLYLAGNTLPHAETFYVVKDANSESQTVNFLTINNEGSGFTTTSASSLAVQPMQGFFVQATTSEALTLTTQEPQQAPAGDALLNIMVSRNRGAVIDNAIVSFGNAPMMNKFRLTDNATELFVPMGSKDMTVVNAQAEGELPVSFRAAENGTYTLTVNPEGVEMNYLHLIDNMTGTDVDLLQTPSYTFEAKTSDYASRFRLVFSANNTDEDGASTGSATFAYFNGSNWTISNMGEATLQVVDVMGRVLSSETLSGNAEVSINQPAGVYMLRLVSGDSVKVQKVVVR